MKHSFQHIWVALIGTTMSCGSATESSTGSATEPASISISAADPIYFGATSLFVVLDGAGNVVPLPSITWSSSNSTVVVPKGSLMLAVGIGSATVTATVGGATDSRTVTVEPLPPIRFASVHPYGGGGRPLPGDGDGDGDGDDDGEGETLPSSLGLGRGEESLASRTCGLSVDGEAFCWGTSAAGLLGNGWAFWPAPLQVFSVPVPVSGDEAFVSLALGWQSTCALTAVGEAHCWGVAQPPDFSHVPVQLVGGLTFASIDVGPDAACGVTPDGTGYCWGSNRDFQLGTGTLEFDSEFQPVGIDSRVPEEVFGGHLFLSIEVGDRFACGLTSGGVAYCWGQGGGSGQLGSAEGSPPCFAFQGVPHCPEPVLVDGGLTFESLTVSEGHACGLTGDGTGYCWGGNVFGQLGSSLSGGDGPVAVAGGVSFMSISAGDDHTCGLTANGAAYCWGSNARGQLGNNSSGGLDPILVSGGLVFTSLTAGFDYTCGMADSGVAYCWGRNDQGELGDGTTTDRFAPVRVVGQPD